MAALSRNRTDTVIRSRPGPRLAITVATIAALWFVSDVGYHYLFPALGLAASYNAYPIATALYYAAWIPVAAILFGDSYGRVLTQPIMPSTCGLVAVLLVAIVVFSLVVPGLLPPTTWSESGDPPDILRATPWYFLPKSVDILFQQFLVVALVAVFAANGYGLGKITVFCAIAFGGAHLLLTFAGVPSRTVIRYTIFATLFALLFPYLILRLRSGPVYSYALHWSYYGMTLVSTHTISPFAD